MPTAYLFIFIFDCYHVGGPPNPLSFINNLSNPHPQLR
jgi:hypothetical protein